MCIRERSLYIEALNNICKKMKETSSIWDLLAKRTDHSLSKEEAEALEQMRFDPRSISQFASRIQIQNNIIIIN